MIVRTDDWKFIAKVRAINRSGYASTDGVNWTTPKKLQLIEPHFKVLDSSMDCLF